MIVAAIPVKRLSEAKSRLSPHLSAEKRSALARYLVQRTIAVLGHSGLVGRVAVVTPEPGLGDALGVEQLQDHGNINDSLRGAAVWAGAVGASGLLVLPGDLPALVPTDIHALLSLKGSGVAIAGTLDGGTGALYLSPPDAIAPSFGPGSYERHLEIASEAAVPLLLVHRDGLSLDLDRVEDLERFRRWGLLESL